MVATGREPGYAVSPDGKRFLIIRDEQRVLASEVELVVNWFEDLNPAAAAKK